MFYKKKSRSPTLFIVAGLGIILLTIIIVNLYPPGTKLPQRFSHIYSIADKDFERTAGNLLGPPMIGGNRIESLENGDQIFPAMIEAIQSATKTITFETFIYWSGDIGQKFSNALSERARAGVKVLVILDAVGSSKLDDQLLHQMTEAGVDLKRYRPVSWYNLSKMNNRTHRKILVIDGVIGFTGGVGIADKWNGHAESLEHWRDSHFKISGPVVSQLQAAFLDNWNAMNNNIPHGSDFFPPEIPSGPSMAQVFTSSPHEGSNNVRLMYILSIELAQKNIRISTAYFIPDEHVRLLLIESARRGVKIEIIVPGESNDSKSSRGASRSIWGDMLKAGIKIYEYQPTMYHSKVMIVDDLWVSVGSTNFDNRSFSLNAESNLNVVDKVFAMERNAIFESDKKNSKEMTYDQWIHRPLFQKSMDKIYSVLKTQL